MGSPYTGWRHICAKVSEKRGRVAAVEVETAADISSTHRFLRALRVIPALPAKSDLIPSSSLSLPSRTGLPKELERKSRNEGSFSRRRTAASWGWGQRGESRPATLLIAASRDLPYRRGSGAETGPSRIR